MKRNKMMGAACAAALLMSVSIPTIRGAEERGYLGVFLTPPSESSAEKDGGGARVEDIARGGAGEKAGLRRGDVITAVNGEKVSGPEALRSRMQSFQKGDAVQLDVRRGSETLQLEAKLGGPPAESGLPADDVPEGKHAGFLGVGFAEVPEALAEHLGLDKGAGVMVGNVWKESPAQKAGIAKNDVIVSVDGKPVRDARELATYLESKKEGDVVKIGVIHKAKTSDLEITLASRPAELRRRMMTPGASRRVIIQSPDGSGRSFALPDDDLWPTDEILRELHENAGSFREWKHPEEWLGRLRTLVDELESKLGEPGDDSVVRSESHSSVLRVKDGEYDITITEKNGNRTVTVKQGDKVLADEIPYAEIDKLPEDVRERVEKAASGFEATPRFEIPEKKVKA